MCWKLWITSRTAKTGFLDIHRSLWDSSFTKTKQANIWKMPIDLIRIEPLLNDKKESKGFIHYSVSFYPCLNVADPEEEEEEQKSKATIEEPPSNTSSTSLNPEDAEQIISENQRTTNRDASILLLNVKIVLGLAFLSNLLNEDTNPRGLAAPYRKTSSRWQPGFREEGNVQAMQQFRIRGRVRVGVQPSLGAIRKRMNSRVGAGSGLGRR